MRRPGLLALSLLLTACAARQGPGASPERARLHFAWPEGQSVQVLTAATDEGEAMGFGLRAARKDAGWQVEMTDLSSGGERPLGSGALVILEADADALATDVRISPLFAEAFQGLEGAAETADQGATLPMLFQMFQEQLRTMMSLIWWSTVELWAGVNLGRDPKATKVEAAQVPWLMGTVSMIAAMDPSFPRITGLEVEQRYAGQVPCTEGETEARCVRLIARARPPEAELEAVRAWMEAQEAKAPGQEPPSAFTAETVLEVITEPATLKPHRLVFSQQPRSHGGEAAGSEETILTFTW